MVITALKTATGSRDNLQALRFSLEMAYQLLDLLGAGSFGAVYKAVHVPSNSLVALKVMRHRDGLGERAMRMAYRGENIILPSLNHVSNALVSVPVLLSTLDTTGANRRRRFSQPHIIRCFDSQGWGTPRVEIVLELMEGTLKSLVESVNAPCTFALATGVLHEMLQALDYLSCLGYVHRDVKPGNIFYVSRRPNPQSTTWLDVLPYHFRLGDFGLCDRVQNISGAADGTPFYMAPELFEEPRRHAQSHKSDVWSLYVTVLWTLDVALLRSFPPCRVSLALLRRAGSDRRVTILGPMADTDPLRRASAAQMLVKCFDGAGLVTARCAVPDLKP